MKNVTAVIDLTAQGHICVGADKHHNIFLSLDSIVPEQHSPAGPHEQSGDPRAHSCL